MQASSKAFAIALVLTIALAASATTLFAQSSMAEAKQDYAAFCAKCHGMNGQGDGPAAATLHTKPRNYTDCAKMDKISDATLFKAIKDGGASVGLSPDMPSWSKGFSDEEIHGLVKFVRSFCKK